MKVFFVAALASAMLAYAPGAFADPETSASLKQRGDELLHASKFKEALEAYEHAYKLEPNPALLYNRSRAHEGLGEWVEALAALEQFAHDASPELKGRVPKLESLLAEQRAHVATLAVTSPVNGASIFVSDKEVGTIPLAKPVRTNAGPTPIEVRAPGYQTFRASMDLPGGTLTTIDAPLVKLGEEPRPPPPPPPQSSGSGRKIVSFALAGTGVAAGVAGAILLGMRESDAGTLSRACPDGLCPSSRMNELTAVRNRALVEGPVAAVLFIGAGVAIGTAIAIWPWSKKPSVVVRGASLSFEGTF